MNQMSSPKTPPIATNARYRHGTWTVTKLKEELRSRNLSPAGNKLDLIDRLERDDLMGGATPPRADRGRSRYCDSPSL